MSSIDAANSYQVHLGTWTNWSRGSVFGPTLTVTRENGNLLIAFVAFFVSLVGTRFWRIVCLIFHYAYSSKAPCDGLHHQRQAFLRNALNPEGSIVTLMLLIHAWRKRASRTWRRILPLLSLTILCVGGWTVASGFSSKVSSTLSNEVLVTSPDCGHFDFSLNPNYTTLSTFMSPFLAKQVQTAASYVKQCYPSSSTTSNVLGCDTYIQKSLATTVITNASCPFSGGICRSSSRNLVLDTGYLDSHADLGLNTPPDQRIQYRRVVQCAPLKTEGYTTLFNLSSDRSYKQYWYGEINNFTNYTFEYSNDLMQVSVELNGEFTLNDYTINLAVDEPTNGSFVNDTGAYIPMSDLARYDGDLWLFFLSSNQVLFSSPVNDPWYQATTWVRRITQTGIGEGYMDVYASDDPASPLACLQQEQFCNPSLPEDSRCSPLSGAYDLPYNAAPLFQDPAALERFTWFYNSAIGNNMNLADIVATLGPQALTARDGLTQGIQGPLADNQWQLEVQHWFATTLATLQAFCVNTATGPNDPDVEQWVVKPNNTEEVNLCQSQKILSTAYTSFSLFGLVFIFVLGSLIIIISFVLEPVLSWLRRRFRLFHYAQLEWCVDETLQLQRLAHEQLGLGTWSRATDAVPVTKLGEEIGMLDLTDAEHPRLSAPLGGRLELDVKAEISGKGPELEADRSTHSDH